MGYIGTDINYGDVSSQTGTGDGADTTPIATLDYSVPTSSSIIVTLDGVTQVPDTDYTVTSGTTLTFTTAPSNLVKILVVFLGRSLGLGTPATGTVTNSTTNFQPGTVFKGDGSSTDGKITLNCSQNTHGVSIQSPAHVSAASYTLTLPTTDGNANELLKTDGNGVLSWTPDIDTTNTNASNLVSGTVDVARLPSTVLNSNVDADLTPAHQGIANLGLIMATEHDKVAFNLTGSFIDIFQDDSGITTETNVDRNASEYISTLTSSTTVTTPSSASDYTGATGSATIGSGTVTWTGTDKSMRSTNSVSGDFEFTGKLTAGDGGGGWLGAFPVSEVGTFADGHEAGDMRSMTNSFFLAWTSRAYVTNGSNKGSAIQTTFNPNTNDLFKLTRVGSTIKYFIDSGSGYVLYTTLTSQTTADMYLCIGGGGGAGVSYTNLSWSAPSTALNATGTLISNAQTVASTSEMSGVFTYTDSAGTNTIGTNLKIYLTANLQGTSPNWTGTTWTDVGDTAGNGGGYGTATTFSGSIKQVKIGKTTVTAGTQVAIKAVWANQLASSSGSSVLISGGTGTIIGSNTSAGLWDGSNTTGQTSGTGTNDWAGKDWGSGNTKTVTGIRVWNNENTYGFNAGGANVEVKLQGSTNGSSWVDLGTTGSVADGAGLAYPFKIEKLSGMTTSTAYRYHRILFNNTTDIRWSELEFYETSAAVTGKIAHLNGWAVNY